MRKKSESLNILNINCNIYCIRISFRLMHLSWRALSIIQLNDLSQSSIRPSIQLFDCEITLESVSGTMQPVNCKVLHYNAVIGVHGEKNALYTRDGCSKSITRSLFTYVNKCPTHRHLVWDISQCIQFYGYNTQTFHKSRYQQVYVGRLIQLQLIYCIYFILITMQNGLFW